MSGQKQIWQQLELGKFGEFNNNLLSKIHIPLQHTCYFTRNLDLFFLDVFHPQIGCPWAISSQHRKFGTQVLWWTPVLAAQTWTQNPKGFTLDVLCCTHPGLRDVWKFPTQMGTHLTFIFDFLGYTRVITLIYYICPCFFGVPRVYSTYFTPQTEFQDGHHNNAISNEILRSNIISSCFIMSEALNSAHSTAKCVLKAKLLTDCWSHFMNRLWHDICSNLVATNSIQYSYNKTNTLDFNFNILAKTVWKKKHCWGSILSCTGPLPPTIPIENINRGNSMLAFQ